VFFILIPAFHQTLFINFAKIGAYVAVVTRTTVGIRRTKVCSIWTVGAVTRIRLIAVTATKCTVGRSRMVGIITEVGGLWIRGWWNRIEDGFRIAVTRPRTHPAPGMQLFWTEQCEEDKHRNPSHGSPLFDFSSQSTDKKSWNYVSKVKLILNHHSSVRGDRNTRMTTLWKSS